jgi:ATP-dependent DNA helicase RecG
MGNRTELASRDLIGRLFQEGQLLHVETFPVSGTDINFLDMIRLKFYLINMLQFPYNYLTEPQLVKHMLNFRLMAEEVLKNRFCTIISLLCFGISLRIFFLRLELG